MLRELLGNWRILLFIAAIIISASAISYVGVQYGTEFTGGTYYQIKLEEKVSVQQMEAVTAIISKRVDAFGFKDTRVNSLGDDLVGVQIAETDPEKTAQIAGLLRSQARFESTLDGNVLFTGSEIINVSRNPADGFGASSAGFDEAGAEVFEWRLPFTLNQAAAERFSKMVFHRCTAVSYDPSGGTSYDCEKTFFFIDRPAASVLVTTQEAYAADSELLLIGNPLQSIPDSTSIDLLLRNAAVPVVQVSPANSGESAFSETELAALNSALSGGARKAIVHPSLDESQKGALAELGFRVSEVGQPDPEVPWVWTATGARQIISITPGIAGLEPYVDDVRNAQIFSQLLITGASGTYDGAWDDVRGTAILLETGSLPIGIESISQETISPLLGKEFLSTSVLIGAAALALVSLVLFLRYRKIRLTVPVIFIGLSELLITVGVSTLLGVRFDLSSVSGVIAAIGTGLNDQIVILDELLKGEGASSAEVSYANRIKKAFFIVIAAAATIIASLSPILIFASYGFGKLAGFAVTSIIGVLIGILITRPAFSIIAEQILRASKKQ